MLKSLFYIGVPVLFLFCCSANATKSAQKPEIKALAKFISYEGGDKIHSCRFAIIKDFSDTTFAGDTIHVAYYAYTDSSLAFDTVLLQLNFYRGKAPKNYFICPDYDARSGIAAAKIDYITGEYWEACEMGKPGCKPLTFTRNTQTKNWFLIMPCGGTESAISIQAENGSFSQRTHFFHEGCPPCLELNELEDGAYSAYMSSCNLGGRVNFALKTKE